MSRPNRDLDQAGHFLQQISAPQHSAAVDHALREIAILDGWGAGQPEIAVQASADLTLPERHADARFMIASAIEELDKRQKAILTAIRAHHEQTQLVNKLRQPKDVTQPDDKSKWCCSHQAGKHDVISWGDPMCWRQSEPGRGGLCLKHWTCWYRARVRDGIDTSKDFQPS